MAAPVLWLGGCSGDVAGDWVWVWLSVARLTLFLHQMKFFTVLMTCGIVLAAPELPVRYDAHKIVRVPRELQRELKGVDVWSYGKDYVEVRVSPKDYERLKQQSSKIVVVENNIQKLIDSERHEFSEWQEDDDYFNNYHTVQEMFRWSRQLQTKYPQLVKMVPSIGKSVQGRDLWAMRITSPNKATKRQVWIQSLLHAREWISGAAGQYVSQALAEGYGRDEAITDILDKVEFVFVPLSNPDGYAYSWAKDRLWRKNRAVFNGSADGVDLVLFFTNKRTETFLTTGEWAWPPTTQRTRHIWVHIRSLSLKSAPSHLTTRPSMM